MICSVIHNTINASITYYIINLIHRQHFLLTYIGQNPDIHVIYNKWRIEDEQLWTFSSTNQSNHQTPPSLHPSFKTHVTRQGLGPECDKSLTFLFGLCVHKTLSPDALAEAWKFFCVWKQLFAVNGTNHAKHMHLECTQWGEHRPNLIVHQIHTWNDHTFFVTCLVPTDFFSPVVFWDGNEWFVDDCL